MLKLKVQNQLHELIKSLTQTEKRYFKLFAQLQTSNKDCDYVLLFNAIEKQKVFNETKIKAHFKGTSIEKRYASLKKYLYELILKCLTNYHIESKDSIKVRRMLDSAEILIAKGLYHQAKRRLDKTEKIAEDAGMLFLLHDIKRLKLETEISAGNRPSSAQFENFESDLNELSDELSIFNTLYNQEMNNTIPKSIKQIQNTVDKEFDKLLFASDEFLDYNATIHQTFKSAKKFYKESHNWEKLQLASEHHYSKVKLARHIHWNEDFYTCVKDLAMFSNSTAHPNLISECKKNLTENKHGLVNTAQCHAELFIAELFLNIKDKHNCHELSSEILTFINHYEHLIKSSTYQEVGYYLSVKLILENQHQEALKLNDKIIFKTSGNKTEILKSLLIQNLLLLNLCNKQSLLKYLTKIISKFGFTEIDFNAFENTARSILTNNLYDLNKKLFLLKESLNSKDLKPNITSELIFKKCIQQLNSTILQNH